MSHLIRSDRVAYAHKATSKRDNESSSVQQNLEQQVSRGTTKVKTSNGSILNETYQQSSAIENEAVDVQNELLFQIKSEAYAQGLKAGEKIGFEKGHKLGIDEGLKQGENLGMAAGLQLAKDEIQSDLNTIDSTKTELVAQVEQFKSVVGLLNRRLDLEIALLESTGVEIVYEVLLKILGNRADERALIEDVLKQCLHKCISNRIVKIRVSLEDFQYLEKEQTCGGIATLLNKIELVPDIQILPGGCVVETDAGNLDARLEQQLESFKKYLLEIYYRAQDSDENIA